ncbi:MAG: branched-chain amino acid ABC transporter permease [Christensenellales bacterium]
MLKLSVKKKTWQIVAVLALLIALPLFFGSSNYVMLLFSTAGIYAIAVSGLDILFGYCGQISLGHSAFYGIGAYTTAILSRDLGMHPFITMIIGATLAMIVGILIAYPVSNLVTHFLSLATIAFCELVYMFITRSPGGITGDFTGFLGIPTIEVFGLTLNSRLSHYFLVVFCLAVFLFIKNRIVKSAIGRAFIAVRDNEHAAGGMGINARKYKVMAFAISAFYAGFAGTLHAHFKLYISPEIITRAQSILLLTMLIFGGRASLIGPIIGACLITFVNESLRVTGTLQMLLYGILLLVILIFMPNGLTEFLKDIKDTRIYKKVVGRFAGN